MHIIFCLVYNNHQQVSTTANLSLWTLMRMKCSRFLNPVEQLLVKGGLWQSSFIIYCLQHHFLWVTRFQNKYQILSYAVIYFHILSIMKRKTKENEPMWLVTLCRWDLQQDAKGLYTSDTKFWICSGWIWWLNFVVPKKINLPFCNETSNIL